MLTRLALFVGVLSAVALSVFGQDQQPQGPVTGGYQYIANSGFENGAPPLIPSWTCDSPTYVFCGSVLGSNNAPSHRGNNFLGIQSRNAPTNAQQTATLSQSMTTPGQGSLFSLSLYVAQPQSGSSFTPSATFNGSPVLLQGPYNNGGTPTSTYLQYTGIIQTPTNSPTTGTLTLSIAGQSNNNYLQIDDVTILGPSIGVVGDPQFVGLRGQSYQVHGMDGEVYNLVTDSDLQVNARFVFLDNGKCPQINGTTADNCWSHPGSYLGAVGVQQVVDGKVEKLAMEAGSASQGFASIVLNGAEMKVGDKYTNGAFSVNFRSSHSVEVVTSSFTFTFGNSDMFVNQEVHANVPLSQLTAHGLFGQTHVRKVYNSDIKYIEGEVDDYVVASQDLFGTDCPFNKFQL